MKPLCVLFLILIFLFLLYAVLLLVLPMRITLRGYFSSDDIRLSTELRHPLFPRLTVHSDRILALVGGHLRRREKKNAAYRKRGRKRAGFPGRARPGGRAKQMFRRLRKFAGRVTTEKFTVRAELGLEDAAATALAGGLFYGFLSLPFALIRKPARDAEIGLRVIPQYGAFCIKIQAEGIFRLRPVHIITVSVAVLGRLLSFAGTASAGRLQAGFTHLIQGKEA